MITVRLSRTLHSALGEDGASDMVTWMHTVDDHRAELRELNEITVGRLETRIGQCETRIDQVETRLEARIAQVETKLEADLRVGLKGLESKIDQRFGDLIKWSFLFWCGAVAASALFR